MDILRLLDELNELAVVEPHKLMGVLPVYVGLNQDEISMQIAKVRASLPQELKVAVSTVRESDRILEQAREDATKVLENARKEAERIQAEARAEIDRAVEHSKMQQERMVSESEILKLSKAQSEEIRNAAERDALQIRRGADQYAMEVLTKLEGVVGKVMATIDRGKQEMQAHKEPSAPDPKREKTRA